MASAPARIRIAGGDDLVLVQWLGCETYRQHFAHCWSEAGLQAFLEREFSAAALRQSLASPGQAWFLLVTGDAGALGYAKLNWARREPVSGVTGAELQKIHFLARAVGHGHGAALLEHVVAAAARRGESHVWLHVLKSNAAARRFYASHAFDTVGELPYRTDLGEAIGMWTMSRKLA